MWTFRSEEVANGRGRRFDVQLGSQSATFADVLKGWQTDPNFRSLFSKQLADAPWPAFRWEAPPVTAATLAKAFEFVLLESRELLRVADQEAFAEHFDGSSGAGVVVFSNLGRDAILVVPCPMASPTAYGHLAAFVREAPGVQQQALWQSVGTAMSQRIGAKPVWLSTAGAGVSWLHVRLDDRPKYYGFEPYRKWSK